MPLYNFTDEQLSYMMVLTGLAMETLQLEGREAYTQGLITEDVLNKATTNLSNSLGDAISFLSDNGDDIQVDSAFVAKFLKAFVK